ncbi:fibronectin type III domain-containing protein [Sediminibacterium sp.]|uniref:fibronectin type III domain-containing protein n=1 Tax=Sediminibacterium sp. TaxID=1917865 RepID=UPI002734B541|nr:fibronectin type III domain-containing protein [Sediminibacterium sp.]MDP3567391.1 fibronectin type III domain-containing protein [Sediminibacterium sp.]
MPPYSGYLPDYADPSAEKLKVILQFNDFSVAQYNLKLKIEIKGNGFTLSTKTFYNPPPITLLPGQPLLLSSIDLAPYLNSNNLDFIGINQNQYEQRMALPEGYYSICVKAYDYYNSTNIQVSNEACAQAWFTLSDPPFLNLPLCSSIVVPQTPQNIIFQWTPMNLGSPLSAGNTEYEFALWEMRPDSNANPNQLVLSAQPVFSTTTQQTFFNYGITETPLNLYMKYVWRVRVKDNTGRDWFKNNGYSQICTFTYGNLTNVIGNALNLTLNAQTINHRTGQCDWTTQSAFNNYLLQVRKQGTSYWFNYPNTSGIEKVSNLEPNTTYECRVRGEGNNITGNWSNIAAFTTAAPPNYACENQTQPFNPNSTQPLPLIKAVVGLVIQSGQFEVITSQIEPNGPPGWYKGKGYALVFGALPVAVKWDNIYIDEDNRQQQGVIEALTLGIDKWMSQWDIKMAEENATYVNGTIDSVYMNGNLVCYSLQGSAGPICVPTPTGVNVMVIRDDEGNQYAIQFIPPPPKITGPTNYLNFSSDSLEASENEIIYFSASANQKFGFDKKEYAAFISNYEAIKLRSGKNYFVSNKSIGLNQTDELIADILIANFNANQLSFKTNAGTELNKAVTNVTNQIKVTGIPANAGCVYAWYNGKKLGKINIYSLKEIAKKVVLVPVNNSNVSITNAQLNEIFKQANITWSVTTAPNFTFNLGNNGLDAADATLMSKYSGEMRALRNAYKNFDSLYDKEAYYLFVVPNFSNQDLSGYMVRGRAVGFIATDISVKEMAHELAHGAFALEHTFPKIEKSTSNNLMDYTNGAKLVKEQWDEISIRKITLNWFDEEESNSALSNKRADLLNLLLDIKKGYKEKSAVNIGKYTSVMTIGKTFISGTQYDYITTIALPFVQTLGVISPNNLNLTVSTFNSSYPYAGVTKPCIDIDGKFKIFVPQAKLDTMMFFLKGLITSNNLLLFVNGYRPSAGMDGSDFSSTNTMEFEDSDNKVKLLDIKGCWSGMDAKFINRIGTKNVAYADGHHSVKTSNHMSVSSFMKAMLQAMIKKDYCEGENKNERDCNGEWKISAVFSHTIPNFTGFNTRKSNGMIAGLDLINKINSGEIKFNKLTDKIDIVAHSMGYAYSTGMIEALKIAGFSKNFGIYYIIAPENATGGGVQWNLFDAVWQYGSDLKEPNQDNIWLQDGVAPQAECPALKLGNGKNNPNTNQPIQTGRIFIPKGFTPKDFGSSHYLVNYHWIFTERKFGMTGYVKPR